MWQNERGKSRTVFSIIPFSASFVIFSLLQQLLKLRIAISIFLAICMLVNVCVPARERTEEGRKGSPPEKCSLGTSLSCLIAYQYVPWTVILAPIVWGSPSPFSPWLFAVVFFTLAMTKVLYLNWKWSMHWGSQALSTEHDQEEKYLPVHSFQLTFYKALLWLEVRDLSPADKKIHIWVFLATYKDVFLLSWPYSNTINAVTVGFTLYRDLYHSV